MRVSTWASLALALGQCVNLVQAADLDLPPAPRVDDSADVPAVRAASPPSLEEALGGAQAAPAPAARPTKPGPATVALPVLSVETISPPEIIVNQSAIFRIQVNNLGDTTARGVLVQTTIPTIAKLKASDPQAQLEDEGVAKFPLGDIPPRTKRVITVELLPEERGTIDLKSRVGFQTDTSLAVPIRQSNVKLGFKLPPQILYGKELPLRIKATNGGDGTASGVRVVVLTPADECELRFTGAREFGTLVAGETRDIYLTAIPKKQGPLKLEMELHVQGAEPIKVIQETQVLRPFVEISASGPEVTYQQREEVFSVTIANPGDAPAQNVTVFATLPAGLEVSAFDRQGQFDRNRRLIFWKLSQLAANGKETFRFKAKSTTPGEIKTHVAITADSNLTAQGQQAVRVLGRSDVRIVMAGTPDPLAIGEPATLDIAVQNRGTQQAAATTVVIALPEHVRAIEGKDYRIEEGKIIFSVPAVAAGQKLLLHCNVVADQAGEFLLRATLASEGQQHELIAEDSVFYFESEPTRVAEKPAAPAEAPQGSTETE